MTRWMWMLFPGFSVIGCGDPVEPTEPTTPTETEPTAGAALGWAAEALLDVVPATLPEETGGTVTAHLAASASRDGAPVALAEAIPSATFTATFADGTVVEASAEALEADVLGLTFDVPAGLAPGSGARTVIGLEVDGQPLMDAAVGLYVDPAALLASFVGDPTGFVYGATGPTICHVAVTDANDDGLVEVLTVGVDGPDLVLRGCTPPPMPGEDWKCLDAEATLEPARGGALVCGQTDHFLTTNGDVGITGVMQADTGHTERLGLWTWNGSSWSGSGSLTPAASVNPFAAVLAFRTLQQNPAAPISSLLAIHPNGDHWDGVYDNGQKVWAWTALGAVTPDQVGLGQAWAGLFGSADLSGGENSGGVWAWSLDPSKVASGGRLVLDTSQFNEGLGAFVRSRLVEIEPPDFDIEAAAAAGEDLDGDGSPELVVEAWGEGRWAAWLVLDATDKGSTAPVRRLVAGADTFGVSVAISGGGLVAVAGSSFLLAGDSRLTSNNPLYESTGTVSSPLYETALVQTRWSVTEAIETDRTLVEPDGGGIVGLVPVEEATSCASGHGVCKYGRCHCTRGYAGATALLGGGGDGSGAASAAAGDVLVVGEDPGGDALVVQRTDAFARRTVAVLLQGTGLIEVSRGMGAVGPALFVDGEAWLDASWDSRVAALPDSAGQVALFAFEAEPLFVGGAAEPTSLQATVRVRYQDLGGAGGQLPPDTTNGGSSVPVVLADEIGPDGGVLLGWRDGDGQAWVGVLDVVGATATTDGEVVPFLDGPVPVGQPVVDPADVLKLSVDNPGMVFVPTSLPSETPLLSIDGLQRRLATWDVPMSGPWSPSTGTHGSVALLVGDDGGWVQSVYLPAVEVLDDLLPVDLTDAAVPSERVLVPRLAARLVPDAPPLVVSVSADGTTAVQLADTGGNNGSVWNFHVWVEGWKAQQRVVAADFDGDGLADLHSGRGGAGQIVGSGGNGGARVLGVPSRSVTNFASAHEEGTFGQECPVDPNGGATWTRGGPIFGAE